MITFFSMSPLYLDWCFLFVSIPHIIGYLVILFTTIKIQLVVRYVCYTGIPLGLETPRLLCYIFIFLITTSSQSVKKASVSLTGKTRWDKIACYVRNGNKQKTLNWILRRRWKDGHHQRHEAAERYKKKKYEYNISCVFALAHRRQRLFFLPPRNF